MVQSKQWKSDMRCGAWKVRSLYRSVSLTRIVRKLARYKIDLVGVKELKWEKAGTVRAGDYIFFYGKEKKIINVEKDFL